MSNIIETKFGTLVNTSKIAAGSASSIKKSGAFYLDYFKALNDGNNGIIKEYSNDGVHLTAKGYHVLEPMLEKALDKVLN